MMFQQFLPQEMKVIKAEKLSDPKVIETILKNPETKLVIVYDFGTKDKRDAIYEMVKTYQQMTGAKSE